MRPGVAALVLPALALVLFGCVATADTPSPTDPHGFTTTSLASTTATTMTTGESLEAFRQCLADQDVTIAPIRFDALGRPRLAEALKGLDLTDRSVLDALESCGEQLGSGALDLSSDPALRDMVQDSLEELAGCLRAWGVEDFPDPVPGFAGVGSPFPRNQIPWNDPDLERAVQVCQSAPS